MCKMRKMREMCEIKSTAGGARRITSPPYSRMLYNEKSYIRGCSIIKSYIRGAIS